MSPAANVRQVQVLHELNSAIAQLSRELASTLRSVQSEINSTLDWLSQREKHWREEVCSCQAELSQAEHAYAACMTRVYDDDHRPTCQCEAAAVAAAQRQLAKAEAELANVLSWRRTVDDKISVYIGETTRLQRAANTTLPPGGLLGVNIPALGAMLGTYLGFFLLMSTSRDRPQAGLPFLNSGVILGFLAGCALAGVSPF